MNKEFEILYKMYKELTPRNKDIFKMSLAMSIANQKLSDALTKQPKQDGNILEYIKKLEGVV